jgi:hypothetical protein
MPRIGVRHQRHDHRRAWKPSRVPPALDQAKTLGCLWGASLSSTAWIGRVGWHGPLERIEEADEFEVAVALHAAANDAAVEHAEGSEQGGGAIR